MSNPEDAPTFLHRKFSLRPTERIADEIGTEISLQYTFEAMEEYAEHCLQAVGEDVTQLGLNHPGMEEGEIYDEILRIICKHIDYE